ncbi:MAG: alpha/beta fold hydrolase, partial [Candidatus Competibacterales bacterium]|nr:alpha/beta fold hydrolase [Candidatus Competibacterales bacterium]
MNPSTRLQDWTRWITVILLGLGSLQASAAELRTTDYYLNHTSIEPFYAEHGLDPEVVLHVREVVLPGRERSAPAAGKVLLLVHGAYFPGYIAFDTDCQNCSMMQDFARHGWDVFTLDIEGYGQSTRPPVMDTPAAFPDAQAPVRSAVAVADVARVVDFIRQLRSVEKVHALGWSLAATTTLPFYAIEYPDTLSSLVLFGGGYTGTGVLGFESDEQRRAWVENNRTSKVFMWSPPSSGFLGTPDEALLPGAVQAWYEAGALDPQFGELGGRFREVPGRFIDQNLERPIFDASRITVPTLAFTRAYPCIATRRRNDWGTLPCLFDLRPLRPGRRAFWQSVFS